MKLWILIVIFDMGGLDIPVTISDKIESAVECRRMAKDIQEVMSAASSYICISTKSE